MDIWTKEKRSYVMSRILSKNTSPERQLRGLMCSLGYKYRLHANELPGKPDVVIRKERKAIFVHGCFWHLHPNCIDGRMPKTRIDYWAEKLTRNKKRDRNNFDKLRRMGWKVLRIWECELERKIDRVESRLKSFMESR